MSNELVTALATVVDRLTPVIAEDADLRSALRLVIAPIFDGHQENGVVEPETEQESTVESQATLTAVEAQPEQNGPLPILDIGSAAEAAPPPTHEDVAARAMRPVTAAVLPEIESRCRLKAEAARWAAARQRRLQEGVDFRADIAPKDRKIIAKAKEMDCFLWMNQPHTPMPEDLSLMENVAGCFEALALAVSVVQQIGDDHDAHGDMFVRSLDLAAEAQSALRSAIGQIDGPSDDDQHKAYRWLREVAAEKSIYIQRYMRVNDTADPRSWPEIQSRIESLNGEFQDARKREKQRRNRIKKVRYHAELIESGKGSDHDLDTIVDTVVDMVSEGIPASNREIRDALLPIIDDLPEEAAVPLEFQYVLREIDRYLSTRSPQPAQPDRPPSPDVVKVAKLLSRKSIVVIGGERRPHVYEALKKAFQLRELTWLAREDYESAARFEDYVARKDVKVVLLATRFSPHGYGNVSQLCEKYSKPLVWLPKGLNPNQVAHQILSQCGKRLAG